MLHETLKDLRKKKGYSQEEAASRLNVVRQTVSKWEKGLSVPDADMLVKLAELYEVTVGELLGAPQACEETTEPNQPDMREVAEQLSRINEQLVVRNRRSRRILKTVGVIILAWILFGLLMTVLTVSAFSAFKFSETYTEETSSITETLDEFYDALPLH